VPGEPSVANEHEWPSWNDFLRGTAALFGGRELCDCYRADYVLGVTPKPPESEKFENRFYVTPDGNTSGAGEEGRRCLRWGLGGLEGWVRV
jgi:hypothetical protein